MKLSTKSIVVCLNTDLIKSSESGQLSVTLVRMRNLWRQLCLSHLRSYINVIFARISSFIPTPQAVQRQ